VTEISCHEKAAAVFLLNDDLSEKTAAALMIGFTLQGMCNGSCGY